MWRGRGLGFLVVGWLFIVWAGCGGEGAPAPEESAGSVEPSATGSSETAGACELVTREDASELFGQPAAPESGPSVPSMIDQCLWTWDTESSNQLLQFSIWVREAYDPPQDSRPLEIGEGGYLRAHPMAGVDVAWIQGGRMISLSYSTVGPEAPEAVGRVDQLEALARRLADRL